MEEQLWFTQLLNKWFAVPANALLHALGITPHHAAAPINDMVAMEVLVALILLVFFILVRARLSVQSPGPVQHVAEMLNGFIDEQSRDIIGHHNARYIPYLAVLGSFVLISNVIGLIPGFMSPTQVPGVPLGCAIFTFVYYHFHGVRHQGPITYLKHFAGPMPAIAWLMFPIEIISHSARLMSLTIRLYANMFAGEMVTLAFFSLVPLAVPVAFMALHLGVAFIQAYIFVLLTMIYLAGSVGEEAH